MPYHHPPRQLSVYPPKKIQRLIHDLDDQYMSGTISRADLAQQIADNIVGQSEKSYLASLRYVVRVMSETFHAFSDVEVTIAQYGLDEETASSLRRIISERSLPSSDPHSLQELLWGENKDRPLHCRLDMEQAWSFDKEFRLLLGPVPDRARDGSNFDSASDIVKYAIEGREALLAKGKEIIASVEPQFKNRAHLLAVEAHLLFEASIFGLLGMDGNQFEKKISANKLAFVDFNDGNVSFLIEGDFQPKDERGKRSFPAGTGYELFTALMMKTQNPTLINAENKWEITNRALSGRDRQRYPQSYEAIQEPAPPSPSRGPKLK